MKTIEPNITISPEPKKKKKLIFVSGEINTFWVQMFLQKKEIFQKPSHFPNAK